MSSCSNCTRTAVVMLAIRARGGEFHVVADDERDWL